MANACTHVATEGEGYLLDATTFKPNLSPEKQTDFICRACQKIQKGYQDGTLEPCDVHATIKHEARVHQVEFNSGAHTNMHSFNAEMHFIRKVLVETAREMGMVYISAGASPVTFDEKPMITPQARYQETLSCLKGGMVLELMKDFDPCAAHFHVEEQNQDTRVRLMNATQEFLWLFLGLSLSSPVSAGNDTGHHSSRMLAWQNFPNAGIYKGSATNQQEWATFVEAQKAIGDAEDDTTMWYWVRACSKQPTYEVRVCDAITYVDDIAPIMALSVALKAYLVAHPDRPIGIAEIADANLGAVSQKGRRAWVNIPTPDGHYENMRFRQAAELILNELLPYAESVMDGTAYPYFEKLKRNILERTAVSSSILKVYHDALGVNDTDEAHAEEAVIRYLAGATAKYNA